MTPSVLSIGVNPIGLATGFYASIVTVGASNALTFTVTLTVKAAPPPVGQLVVTPTSLSFQAKYGDSGLIPQSFSTSSTGGAITYTLSTSSTGNWLSVIGSQLIGAEWGGTTPGSVSVFVNAAGLSPGTYNGTVTISAPTASNSPRTVAVSLTVSAPTISVSPSLLNFAYQSGGSVPAPRSMTMTASSAMAFTAAASGGSWLAVSPASGTTPASLTVSVNPAGLTPGTYNGTITITAPGASNSPRTVSVSLTVTSAPTIGVSPSLLNFSYQSGGNLPQPQVVTVFGSATTAFTASATGASWLAVTPASGTTPASLSVSVNPAGLNPGTHYGMITVTAPGASNSPQTVSVSLTVTAPTFTAGGVANAANYVAGKVSPGEIIVIFGKDFGPATLAGMQLANGMVATETGETRVLFDGVAAPMVYAINGQISCVVPYEVADKTTTQVVIEYRKVKGAAVAVPVVEAVPGIFSIPPIGTGQGAILNQDWSVNGAASPAPIGSVIMVYATGEGKTDIPISGRVTPGGEPFTRPLLTGWSATVGGKPSPNVWFAGSAPGSVAGVFQVNLEIPSELSAGNHELIINSGKFSSQPGLTVAVK